MQSSHGTHWQPGPSRPGRLKLETLLCETPHHGRRGSVAGSAQDVQHQPDYRIYADIRLFSHVNLKSFRKQTAWTTPEIIYVCGYRLIYGSIAFDFLYGKENEIHAMLYCVYTSLYSVQISICSYILIQDFISIDETCISGYIHI